MKLLRNKLAVTIIVLSVTFLGIIIYTASRDVKGLEGSAGSALTPLEKMTYNLNRGLKDFVDFFLNFSDIKVENKELSKENNDLRDELAQNSDLKAENERLRGLLDFKMERSNYDYITTNIIGKRGNILDGYIVDKGTDDGIAKGMVVIASDGLVGQVYSVSKNWSIVQCIINEDIAVSVMSESSRENTGILEGFLDSKNNYRAKVSYLPLDSQIKEGDVILTSGLGLVYPKEIRVGVVVSVEEDKVKVMKNVVVKPYVEIGRAHV